MPVLAFIRIIVGTNMSKKLEKYSTNPGLNKLVPNYRVDMGFGLQVGWAIEVFIYLANIKGCDRIKF